MFPNIMNLQVNTVDQTVHPPPNTAVLANISLMAVGPLQI